MTRRIAHAAQIGALVLALALVPAALAARGGGGKPPSGGAGGGGGSLSLVVLDSTDGLPHWGNHVTFNVSTTASQPYVTVDCYQNGVWVLSGTRGFYPDYLWGQTFALNSAGWTGGAADCSVKLFTVAANGKSTTLATASFHVYA
jgi:hypothetical protein